jgi:hemerythrin-like domain-containing protein
MEPSATGPADTTMMGIVHSALRRDLDRVAVVLGAEPPPGVAQRQAVAAHIDWMMHFLHAHHAGEDDGLWPLVRSLDPSAGDLLDQMDADHVRIASTVDALTAAGRRYGSDGSPQARDALAQALTSLREVLDPHLRSEEDEMMPVVAKTLTHGQWEAFNQEFFIKPKSKKQLGQEGHWLIDSIDPAGYAVVVGNVPPVPRFILLKVFAKPYARDCAARWGASVPVKPDQGAAGLGR